MFVRIKTIKGRKYAYQVQNEWTPWGSRQKVTKYLGKTHFPKKVSHEEVDLPTGFSETIGKAVEQELLNHGFTRQGNDFVREDVTVSISDKKVRQGKRSVVLAMNEGYMCEDTITQLHAFEMLERPDASAKKLASLALEAGLKLSDGQFVHLFEQVKDDST